MAVFRLEAVRRKSGGRVHLTPRVPSRGAVTTLCGQTLADGTYAAADTKADCANCIRRSRDPSRISSAFFAQEEGAELLRLSLEQARKLRPGKAPAPGSSKPNLRVVPTPPSPPPLPQRVGELVTAGFKSGGQGVWRSPAGVVVRMTGPRRERFAELVFEGSVVATREDAGIRLTAGDVEVRPAERGVEVRVRKP